MALWQYDGTLAGFLTLCAELVRRRDEPADIRCGDPCQPDLFGGVITIVTDDRIADRMLSAIATRMSPTSCRLLRLAFLSEAEGVEMLLWRYLSFGRKQGRATNRFLSHPAVAPVHRLARAVEREAHRLTGVIRFRETPGGYWYARVEPAHRVLELIAPHFSVRFAAMPWLIHDCRRDMAVAWNGTELRTLSFSAEGSPDLSRAEREWSELWRGYVAAIAIPERNNVRLQRQFLPERFRRHLTEMT